MAITYQELFTAANGTLFNTHTAVTGQTYSTADGAFEIQGNQLVRSSGSTTILAPLDQTLTYTASYVVEFDLTLQLGTIAKNGMAVCFQDTNQTYYFVRFNPVNNLVELYKTVIAQGETLLDSWSYGSWTGGTTLNIKLFVEATQLRVLVNDVERIVSADVSITRNGNIGYRFLDGTGVSIDNATYEPDPTDFDLVTQPTEIRRNTSGSFVVNNTAVTPTTGNVAISNGGDNLTIDSVTGSGPYTINFTCPNNITKQHNSTGLVWTVTVGVETVDSNSIPFLPPSGWEFQDLTDPVILEGSFLFASVGTPSTGQQLVFESSTGLSVKPSGEWVWNAAPASNQTIDAYVISADGSIGNTGTTTFAVTAIPILTNPTGTKTGANTADGTVTTTVGNGTLYAYASTNTTETVNTVRANGNSKAVTASGLQTISVSGLVGNTQYYLHFAHADDIGNESLVVSSDPFTTDAVIVFATDAQNPVVDTSNNPITYTFPIWEVWDKIPEDPTATVIESGTNFAVSSGVGSVQLNNVSTGVNYAFVARDSGNTPNNYMRYWGQFT